MQNCLCLGGLRLPQWEKLIVDRRSLRNFQIHPYDNKSQALAVNSECHCSNKRRHYSDCGHLINRARAFNKAKCLSRDYHYGKQHKTGQLQRFIPFLCHSHSILANKCVFLFSWSYIAKPQTGSLFSQHFSTWNLFNRIIPWAGQVWWISGITKPNGPAERWNSLLGT